MSVPVLPVPTLDRPWWIARALYPCKFRQIAATGISRPTVDRSSTVLDAASPSSYEIHKGPYDLTILGVGTMDHGGALSKLVFGFEVLIELVGEARIGWVGRVNTGGDWVGRIEL